MAILEQILDRVKQSDVEKFRVKLEAKEVESRKFVNAQGMDTMQDIIERKLSEEQMVFQFDLDATLTGSSEEKPPEALSTPIVPDSDIYKKFLEQLK